MEHVSGSFFFFLGGGGGGSNQVRRNLKNKCQSLNNVGQPDPQTILGKKKFCIISIKTKRAYFSVFDIDDIII